MASPDNHNSKRKDHKTGDSTEKAVALEEVSVGHGAGLNRSQNLGERPATGNLETDADAEESARAHRKRRAGARWWALAATSALLLVLITAGAIYLITKRPSTVDQLVILTVPSGAEVKLDSKEYGNSPVKLERVPIGTYTLEVTKEGFEPVVERITISDSQPLELRLKPLAPSEAAGLSREEQIKQSETSAEAAFARNHLGIPFEGSALSSTLFILSLDPSNQFALEMKDRIQKGLHQSAQAAVARGDMGQAQESYSVLVEYYPEDEGARAALTRLEGQLSARRGEVQNLVTKAQEAMRAGYLIEPARTSAYYYSKQALAIDRQNAQARAVRNQVKDKLAAASEQAYARGDVEEAVKQLEQIVQFFPEEKQLRTRLREISTTRTSEQAKVNDPSVRRVQGLEKYRRGDFQEAIPDLEFASVNGRGTPDVIFALGRAHLKIGQLDRAALYFQKMPKASDDTYRSSIAALGDIAMQRGDTATALERYKEARQLGGSNLYPIANLDDKIERIERREREKAEEPYPVSIQVRHLHGSLRGACSGTLTVNSGGVRYEGSEGHQFSSNFVGVNVRVSGEEMTVSFGKPEKFKVGRADAQRFTDGLIRYQRRATAPSNN